MKNKRIIFFADECKYINSVCSPYNFTFAPGTYFLEVWGAQGGNSSINNQGSDVSTQGIGGKGGYSRGILHIKTLTKAFIYVGQKGFVVRQRNTNSQGTFGGGGNLTITKSTYGFGCIGGGASDIRLGKDDLYHRVIVSGGGGGASGGENGIYRNGGDAGGIEGDKGVHDTYPNVYYTLGGNQKSGGNYSGCSCGKAGYPGEFGLGGGNVNGCGTNYGGSGGGGWFGGAGGCHRISGAGGSGYAFNFSSHVPSGFKLNRIYYLHYVSVLGGKSYFPIASNELETSHYETGHQGNGAVRISLVCYATYSLCKSFTQKVAIFCLIIIMIQK